jgi:hypothetical protein
MTEKFRLVTTQKKKFFIWNWKRRLSARGNLLAQAGTGMATWIGLFTHLRMKYCMLSLWWLEDNDQITF